MQNTKTTPRDFFLHLLAIVALYASVAGFLTLAFQFLNVLFPDTANIGSYYYLSNAYDNMRWAIAMLVVLFPVYLFTMRFLGKDAEKFPEKKESRVRRWLTYFTLFVAALAVIVDLVVLILWFLKGEIAPRFLLKTLSVFFVAGSIFGYYFAEMRKEKLNLKVLPGMKPFVSGVIIIVIALTILGALKVGSPKEERMRRIDEERVTDLQMIQSQVVSFWVNSEKLPVALADIENTAGGFVLPKDPETGAAYEYEKTGDLTFTLCANFNAERTDDPLLREKFPVGEMSESWAHSAGRDCFERTINPNLYSKPARD